MRINEITIRNFRGFASKKFSFDKQLTLIVGNNTAGKTTLLHATRVALGAYLRSLKQLPNDKAYSLNFAMDDVMMKYNASKKDFFKAEETTRIDVDADMELTTMKGGVLSTKTLSGVKWFREMKGNQTPHSRECAGELMDIVDEMEHLRETKDEGTNAVYPLVLSFGVNRIDNQYRAAKKTKARESNIAKAYKSALRDTVDFQGAFDWLYRFDMNLKRDKAYKGTDSAFIKALTTAIPAMTDVIVNSKDNEFMAKVAVDGMEPEYQTFDHMSDGFKSMICIVAEIAHRCIELNGFLGEKAVVMTPGVVIIDELDLYLHPRWQRHVLKDLCAAFPMIQFVVTSHSPFVIQSVKKQNLIALDGTKDTKDPVYRSIEEIVLSEMNMNTPRSAQYQLMVEQAEQFYQMVKRGDGDSEAAKKIDEKLRLMEEEFSDNPSYVALLRAERNSR